MINEIDTFILATAEFLIKLRTIDGRSNHDSA